MIIIMHLPVSTVHQNSGYIPPPMSPLRRFLRVVHSKRWLDKCLHCPHALIEMATIAHRQACACTDGRSVSCVYWVERVSGCGVSPPTGRFIPHFSRNSFPAILPRRLCVGYKCTTYTKGEFISRSRYRDFFEGVHSLMINRWLTS